MVARVLHVSGIIGLHADGGYILYAPAGPHCGITFYLDPQTSEMMNTMKGDQHRMLAVRGAGAVSGIGIHGECKPGTQP